MAGRLRTTEVETGTVPVPRLDVVATHQLLMMTTTIDELHRADIAPVVPVATNTDAGHPRVTFTSLANAMDAPLHAVVAHPKSMAHPVAAMAKTHTMPAALQPVVATKTLMLMATAVPTMPALRPHVAREARPVLGTRPNIPLAGTDPTRLPALLPATISTVASVRSRVGCGGGLRLPMLMPVCIRFC